MLKALMKKQLMELNQSLFVNMKSGERKPRAKVILSITMFAVLMIVIIGCLLYTSPSPRDTERSRMPSSA